MASAATVGLRTKQQSMTQIAPLIAFPSLEWGTFLERNNRFSATILWRQKKLAVHVPSSGRMSELFCVGAPVAWRPFSDGRTRKTAGQLLLTKTEHDVLVCVDSLMPNRLVWKLWQNHLMQELEGIARLRREVPFGQSRLDFAALDEGMLIEVKSVTLVRDQLALFPDSPTTRGTKHVLELAEASRAGWESLIVFVIQRQDAASFSPHAEQDPLFAVAVRKAVQAGVTLIALESVMDETGIYGVRPIPVEHREPN